MDDYSETKGEEKDDSSRSSRKYRFKIIQTACVYAAYISLGLGFITGPTLPDLQALLGISVETSSWLFAGSAVGYLIGSFCGGVLFDRYNKHLVLGINCAFSAIGTALIPWSTPFASLLTVTAITNAFFGVLDSVCNAMVLHIWGSEVGPYIQALHFSVAVGSFLGPLVCEPFLLKTLSTTLESLPSNNSMVLHLPKDTDVLGSLTNSSDHQVEPNITGYKDTLDAVNSIINTLYSNYSSGMDINPTQNTLNSSLDQIYRNYNGIGYTSPTMQIGDVNQYNGSGFVSQVGVVNSNHDNYFSTGGMVHVAYGIIGGIKLITALPFFVLFFVSPKMQKKESELEALGYNFGASFMSLANLEEKPHLPCRVYYTFIGIVMSFTVFQCAINQCYSGLLTTFVVSYLQWSSAKGALLTSAFFGALALGRLVAIPTAKFIQPSKILIVDFLLLGVSVVLSNVAIDAHWVVPWICAILLGGGLSSMFPSAITWVEQQIHVTGRIMSSIVVSGCLGMAFPPLVGYLFERAGPIWLQRVLLCLGASAVLSMGMAHILIHMNNRRNSHCKRHHDESTETQDPFIAKQNDISRHKDLLSTA